MNILVVSSKYPYEYSGSGLRCHNTYLRLQKKYGINYRVLTSSVTENSSCEYEIDDLSVTRISLKPFCSYFFLNYGSNSKLVYLLFRAVGKIFYRLDYIVEAFLTFSYLFRIRKWIDFIHVYGNVNVTGATLTFSKIFGKKILYEVVNFEDHKDYNPLTYYEPFILRLIFGTGFRSNWYVVAISEILEDLCVKHNPKVNIIHRPNPVDELKFHPVSYEIKNNLRHKLSKFEESDIVIVNISKFMPRKNQILIVDALQYLPKKYKLLLIGPLVTEGPFAERDFDYYESIQKLTIDLNLTHRIQIKTGFIDNVEEYFSLSDVFVFPSMDEALGTPMLESLACGIPVVMSRIKGVSDVWIDDGINGFLSDLNPKELARNILLSQNLTKENLSKKSKDILNIASTALIDKKYMTIFEKIMNINGDVF